MVTRILLELCKKGCAFTLFFLGNAFVAAAPISTPPPNPEVLSNPQSDAAGQQEAVEQYKKRAQKLLVLAEVLCRDVYPAVSDDECYDRIYHGVVSTIDPHSAYMNQKEAEAFFARMNGELEGVGFVFYKSGRTGPIIVTSLMEGGPAHAVGIKAGDLITKINGKLATEFTNSNAVREAISGKSGTTVTLSVRRKDVSQELVFMMTRAKITVPQVKARLLSENGKTYGLIETTQFGQGFRDDMETAVRQLQKNAKGKLSGFILSVVNNGGGSLTEVVNTVDLFMDVDAPSTVLQRTRTGLTVYGKGIEAAAIKHTPGDITNGIPILVVVDGYSASASEILAASLKHFGRATIAGTTGTFQKGTFQATMSFTDKSMIKLTEGEYLIGTENDWIPVQCIGVTPDIILPPIVAASSLTAGNALPDEDDRVTECKLADSVRSGGLMKDAPKHRPISEANPKQFEVAQTMAALYQKWFAEKIAKEEALIKQK